MLLQTPIHENKYITDFESKYKKSILWLVGKLRQIDEGIKY